MTYRIRLQPSGHEFEAEGRESVLDAALRSGIRLDHGCASGNCGQCVVRLLSGTVKPVGNSDYCMPAAAKSRGCLLACASTATSDLVIEAPEAASAADVPVQRLRATVKRVTRVSRCFSMVRMQTSRSRLLRFLAGQRVRVTLERGSSGEYHIASCPCDGRNLDVLLRVRGNDAITESPLEGARAGSRVAITGPFGDFVLDEDSRRHRVFVAVGTGMGPVLSLVEQSIAVGRAAGISLYRADYCSGGGYLDNLFRSWQDALETFHYRFLALAGEDSCRRLAEHLDRDTRLRDSELYLAGPESQIAVVETSISARPFRVNKEATA